MNSNIFNKIIDISNNNKYQKIYIQLVSNAYTREYKKEIKYEKHHIIPKSFTDISKDLVEHKNNIVFLTPKEHFIAHLLLTKMFSNSIYSKKMNWAFYQLRLQNKNQQRYTNSRMYEYIKKVQRKFIILYNKNKKIYVDVDDIQKIEAEVKLGATYEMPEEYKIGRVGNMKGKKHSKETKTKMSVSAKQSPDHGKGVRNLSKEEIFIKNQKAAATRKQRELETPGIYDHSRNETRRKVKALYEANILSNKGTNNPRYGVKLNASTKKLISEKKERAGCAGYTHRELFDIFIKSLLDQQYTLKEICMKLPCKKTPFYLKKIISKYSEE